MHLGGSEKKIIRLSFFQCFLIFRKENALVRMACNAPLSAMVGSGQPPRLLDESVVRPRGSAFALQSNQFELVRVPI